MATASNIHPLLVFLRHMDSFTLLSYRDSLREMNLSAPVPPMVRGDGEKPFLHKQSLATVTIIDTTRKCGRYTTMGTHETAINHHIATNLVLKERKFTEAIDNPELTIDLK
jgi:hypothetical protein